MEYTIPAIPTIYAGRRYRSRLEARWAAFFDLLGWNVEYEPSDLGAWSPDFALWGPKLRRSFPVLVEVKPIEGWHRATARKMADSVTDWEARQDGCVRGLLLLGIEPFFSGPENTAFCQIGWYGEGHSYEFAWTEGLIAQESGAFDIVPNSGAFCQAGVFTEMSDYSGAGVDKAMWIEAANRVQWQPRKKT